MTAVLALGPLDSGQRCRLTEAQWRVAAALADAARLPAWAAPLDAGEPHEGEPVELDDALAEALALGGSAVLEVEIAATAGDRGVLAVVRTDGTVAAALVRGVEVRRSEGGRTATRLRPGLEVSAFPLRGLVAEVLRLVPDAPVTVPAEPADVPVELSVGLARALRSGDDATAAAVTAELGLTQPPTVVDALARTLDGDLVLTTRSAGRPGASVGSWLRCAAGWVEVVPRPGDVLRHRPCTRDDIARTLLLDLTGRLDTALRGQAPADGQEDA